MTTGIDLSLFSLQSKLFLSQTLLSSLSTSSSNSTSDSNSIGSLLTSLLNVKNSAITQTSNISLLNLNSAAMALNASNTTSIFSKSSTPDASTLETDITNFVSAFNKAVQLDAAGSSPTGELASLAENNSEALASIGITVNSDGTLSVDEAALKNAIANDSQAVEDAFNGAGSFAAYVQSKAMNAVTQSLSGVNLLSSLYGSSSSSDLMTTLSGLLYNTTA
ncbi:MAG TPA: flagellar filament capping protein FliD [bacterium]|nr:flagellar filament capping protein FliD [bacterium]